MQPRQIMVLFKRNIVTNGAFNGTAGWTTSDTTQAIVNGEMEITAAGSPGAYSSQTLSTVVGRRYRVTGFLRAPSASTIANTARVYVYDTPALSSLLGGYAASVEDVTQQFSFEFTATASNTLIQLGVASAAAWGAIGDKAYFSNIAVR